MINKDFELISNKGQNIYFEKEFRVFTGHENIYLGSNIYLVDTLINAGNDLGRITIEDYVFFGHGVKLLARGHDYTLIDEARQQAITEKPIYIKQGAWVSSGAIILGGVTIGKNAVVAAGSVVTKDIPDNAIFAGNPAKFIRYIHKKTSIFEKVKNFIKKFFS
ncbi:acyltransferase [Poseidonibacter lekithochrous]|uniref:acyltransferase n=1 Tax=Poseidonibacter TaxID=2321187 RepID=UPI001C08F74F|nr:MULTISPECIES: acyltransferase [Poseidonibacter]MBU3014237.1 acyltransferase [Poseidonibacter lekithochrous]MDO6827534.1 acyltransferase [Poseidonibacter sp. 1_MG-2023]